MIIITLFTYVTQNDDEVIAQEKQGTLLITK